MTTETNVLAEGLAALGFPWFDDAVAHAHWLAGKTGRRRRVCWDRRRQLWTLRPAVIVLRPRSN